MNVEIRTTPFDFSIHGFSGIAPNKDYVGIAFALSDKMWKVVKSGNIKNKGKNIWVYENGERVFAGVELEDEPGYESSLEQKKINLKKYAYYKHTGPYNLIRIAGAQMQNEIKKQGFETDSPYIEIYGHWTNDESKLETELLMGLK